MLSWIRDPFGRSHFLFALVLAVLLVLLDPLGLAWRLLAALLVAVFLTVDLVRRLEPVRRRIVGLAEESGRAARPPASATELAGDVEHARERLAEARRKAERERDDVLGILEATTEGILVLGHQHRIEMLNDQARLLLQPTVDPLGRSLHEVVRHAGLVRFADRLRRGKEPAMRTFELAVGGETRVVGVSGALVRGDRVRRRAVLVLNDLSEIARLQGVRTEFVANVTHEMRSPLASILGYAETLSDEPDLSEDQRDHLERILRNARRLDDIIRDLIELSRLEHATAPQIEPSDVEGLVRDVTEAFRDAAEDRGLDLRIQCRDLPEVLPVDQDLLRQALSNLVDNAVKYTPDGGRIEVQASLARAERGRLLRLDVRDTGRGIPEDQQARIFERFYRVDTGRSRSLGGTGLGLAIVKHASALHGGRVELESSGDGSTFTVVVPLPA